jgi:hypothetical protein
MAKAKQKHLEGMEPPSIPAIDRAADTFVDARNAFQNAQKKMEERREILDALMHEHQLEKYEYDGKLVKYEGEPKLKVVAVKEPKE